MGYQRKKRENSVCISPVVDSDLYYAVKSKGYDISEIINMALAAVLEIDEAKLVRYETILEARERLQKIDYKSIIQRVKDRQRTEELAAVAAEEKKQADMTLFKLVVKSCKPEVKKGMSLHGKLISLQNALESGRDSDALTREIKLIKSVLEEHGYLETTSDTEIHNLLEKSLEVWLLEE